jgi:ATP-dependent DNA helicase RecG
MTAVGTRLTLDTPIAAVVKAADVPRFKRIGIANLRDLLFHFPYEQQRFGGPTALAAVRAGQEATVIGTVTAIKDGHSRNGRLRWAEALVDDGTGQVKVTWFRQHFLVKSIHVGDRIALAGQVKSTRFSRMPEMINPHQEVLVAGRQPARVGGLMAMYHVTDKLNWKRVADAVERALPLADELEETLPDEVRRRHRLPAIADAVRGAHRPKDEAEWDLARRRVAFAGLFELQAAFLWLRRLQAVERATPIPYRQEVIDRFKAGLGFELTRAQRRATWDAFQDMQREVPMNRLIDGDVGSGKTAVAAACAAMAHAAGLQTVVMAPTEILARQHLEKFRSYLEDTFPDLKVELLVSGQPAPERRRVLTAAASGHCAVLVGTHALIEGAVQLASLGLAVVDEQHRFGTRQRELLRAKAGQSRPHFLAMTATPIPRTLALAFYGEMALSIIDELPPGRTPVVTEVLAPAERERAYELVRREVRAGRQAFVICPLIEESETIEVRAATAEFERLRREVFPEPEFKLALVHGRLKEKDEVMTGFRDGQSNILVATPVIEVGVDVPNATVMLVEGADRFGLAQLHQFRGRVGRSARQSYCMLLADDPSAGSLQRLLLMAGEHDGFRLAEADMQTRGAGHLLGSRQHGETDVAMRSLAQPQLLSEAREEAQRVLDDDPGLDRNPGLLERIQKRLAQTSIS